MTPYQKHKEKWLGCQLCSLCEGRSKVVLARGNIPCDVLLIGEAPGDSEDVLGKPFIGPAGKLLDQIIWESIKETSATGPFSWAFTNTVACFPKEAKKTDNHEPPIEAIKACAPRLKEFVEICKPKLIVMVGKLAQEWVPKATARIEKKAKDKAVQWCSIQHPAAILRADQSQNGLLIQRCVQTLSQALEDL